MKKGMVFVISGPSGSGKSTIISEFIKIHKKDFFLSISATTRSPRRGEKDSREYYFYTKEKFTELIKKGEFIEFAKVLDNYYGTPLSPLLKNINKGKNVIMDIDVQGAKKIKRKIKDCITIFILPPDLKELKNRLKKRRTDSIKSIKMRLQLAKKELQERQKYDYIIVNRDIVETVKMLENIVKLEQFKRYKI